jgi:hypothetical protein
MDKTDLLASIWQSAEIFVVLKDLGSLWAETVRRQVWE